MKWVTNVYDYRQDDAREVYEQELHGYITQDRAPSWEEHLAWCQRYAIGTPLPIAVPGAWSIERLEQGGYIGLYETKLVEE